MFGTFLIVESHKSISAKQNEVSEVLSAKHFHFKRQLYIFVVFSVHTHHFSIDQSADYLTI